MPYTALNYIAILQMAAYCLHARRCCRMHGLCPSGRGLRLSFLYSLHRPYLHTRPYTSRGGCGGCPYSVEKLRRLSVHWC